MNKCGQKIPYFYFKKMTIAWRFVKDLSNQFYNLKNLTALYEQFTERFEGQLEQVFVYQIPSSHTPLLENWQRVETELPFYCAWQNAL